MNAMIRRAGWLVMALMFALTLGAPQASAQDKPTPTAQAQSTPAEQLDALIERMDAATEEFFEKNWKAELSAAERNELYAKRPGLEFIPEFEAIAVQAKGSDVAAKAILKVLSIQCDFRKKAEAEKTLERLLDDSIASPALAELPMLLLYSYRNLAGQERVTNTLDLLLEKSPARAVKAGSLFALGQLLCGSQGSDTQKAQGRKHFERLIAEFADVESQGMNFKQAAAAFLFEMDHLQIGMVAPDFESIDENGTKFKLSDYRGKVTVIDFWGNW